MRVICITIPNCPKCEDAKRILKDYPIEWMEYKPGTDSERLVKKYNLVDAPEFILFHEDGFVEETSSVLKVKKIIEESTHKQE